MILQKEHTEELFVKNKDLLVIVSISCTVIMMMLFISSLSEYLSTTPMSQMLIDDSSSEVKLQVVFDIQFLRVPCSLIYVDSQDILGFSAVFIFFENYRKM